MLGHGDLWIGNVLRAGRSLRQRNQFVISDWPGSDPRGYPIFDLVTLLHSTTAPRRFLVDELEWHCKLIVCEPQRAILHLTAALAGLSAQLEQYPGAFVVMADACVARVQDAVPAR